MFRTFSILFLALLPLVGMGQKSDWYINQGDASYQQEHYAEALIFYERAVDIDTENTDLWYKLAQSYRLTFQYTNAESYYEKVALTNQNKYPLSIYFLGLMLKYNGDYGESTNYLKSFQEKHGQNSDLKNYLDAAKIAIEGNRLAEKDKREHTRYKAFGLPQPINTKYNDYALSVMDEKTIFVTSGRITRKGNQDRRFGEGFTDIYRFTKNEDTWKPAESIKSWNTKYNDGSGLFNKSKDKYYYTSCTPNCKILVSVKTNDKWGSPQLLNKNINNDEFDSRQPSISHGGDTLFFVSNRPGGLGGNDIWMSITSGGDTWGPAQNLGSVINTSGDEASPKTTLLSNIILFASNGHAGYGGLDIFMAKKVSTGDTLLYNLGAPFNTSKDDMLPEFASNFFYWSSNRNESLGNFDLFETPIRSELAFLSSVSLKSASSESSPKITARLGRNYRSRGLKATKNEGSVTYEDLYYEDQLLVNEMYKLKLKGLSTEKLKSAITDEKYQLLLRIVNDRLEDNIAYYEKARYEVNITPKKSSSYTLKALLIDSAYDQPLANAQISIMNSDDVVIKRTTTNANGEIRMTNIPYDSGNYIMVNEIPTFFSHPLIINQEISYPIEVETKFDLEKIYFSFNSYELRPEAKVALLELSTYLIKNQNSQLEILGYTDNKGSSRYNFILSQKRAKVVMDYLISQGVDPTILSTVPKGKGQPIISDNHLLGQQLNRRVEFRITGDYKPYTASSETYFNLKVSDWKKLSNVTKVPLEDLLKINNVTSEETIKAFTPIRLPTELSTNKLSKLLIKPEQISSSK